MNRVSVVIPTYNRAHMLREAVESALGQSLEPAEILVVDDGSTDLTPEILSSFGNKIRYFKGPHRGVSSARNKGWRLAESEWIAFLDSDDLWLPNKLHRQMKALAEWTDIPLCYTDEIWIRHGKRVNPCKHHAKYSGWIFQHCLARCIISPSSALIRKEILEELGGFDEQLPVCEDYDLWLRLTSRYPVLFLEEKLILKRGGHGDQLSRSYWGLDRFRIRVLAKLLQDPTLGEQKKECALLELKKKCAIYAQGARKRGKEYEADFYERLASKPFETDLERWPLFS